MLTGFQWFSLAIILAGTSVGRMKVLPLGLKTDSE
jgi:hypothetical protein